jgi:hypothetical protein
MPDKRKHSANRVTEPVRKGLKAQELRQAKRRRIAEAYTKLVEVWQSSGRGPEATFRAAQRAGETTGLSLTTFKRKCQNPSEIGHEWECAMVLPAGTEDELVDFLIHQNRNGEPLCKADVDVVAIRALEAHAEVQAAGGRYYKPLSPAAREVLKNRSVGRHFFHRFHAKYEKQLSRKSREVSVWCCCYPACDHH